MGYNIMDKQLPKRKNMRLPEYDYSNSGYYFITICTVNRKNIFSEIVGQGLAPAEIKLTEIGKIAINQLFDLEKRYSNVKIDKYVIMPNHIHLILIIKSTAGASPCPTVSDIICAYKSLTTRECRVFYPVNIWQKSFYDHIIRDENDYLRIWEYIDTNPQKWPEDKYFIAD